MTTTPTSAERTAFEAWYQPERSPTDGLTVAKAFSAGWSAAQAQPVPAADVPKGGDISKAKYVLLDSSELIGSHKVVIGFDTRAEAESTHESLINSEPVAPTVPAKQEPCKHEWLTLKEDGVGALTVCRFCRATKPLDLPAKQEPQRCEHVAYQGNPCLPCGAAVPAIQVQEPVAWLVQSKTGLIRTAWTQKPSTEQLAVAHCDGDTVTPLYATPQPEQPAALKDHRIAEIVNELRDIAIDYSTTQQLRARIADYIVPHLKAQQSNAHDQRELPALSDVEIDEIASGVFPDTFYSKPYKYKFARAVLLAAGSKP